MLPAGLIEKFDEDQPRAEDGKWTGAGGGEGQGSSPHSGHAAARLAALPEAPEGYRHFDGFLKPGESSPSQVRMKDLGFKGIGTLYGRPANEDKIARVQELDPAKVHYTQSSVIREAVDRKLKGENTTFGGAKADLPLVVKVGDEYHLQDGNHRAAADALLTGKLHARVIEAQPPKGRGKVTWRSPGEVKKMSEAIEVENVDKAVEGAFLRLSAGLPNLARELAAVAKVAGELGEDLVAVPAAPPSALSLAVALSDLELLEKALSGTPEAVRARRLRALMRGLGGTEKAEAPFPKKKPDGKHLFGDSGAGPAGAVSGGDGGSAGGAGGGSAGVAMRKDAIYCSRCKDEIPCSHFDADGELTEVGRAANERAKARKNGADAPTTGGDVSTSGLAANGGMLAPAQGRKIKKIPPKPSHEGEQPGVLPQYREINLGTEVTSLAMRDETAKTSSGTSLGLALASSSGPPPRETPDPKKKPDGKHLFPADVGAHAVEAGGSTSGEGDGGGMVTSSVSMRAPHFTDSWANDFAELLTAEELAKRVRSEMPQIPVDKLQELVTFLRDRGMKVSSATVSVGELKSSQDDLNMAKVGRIKEQGLAKLLEGPDLLISSWKGEHSVLDGHHRAAAIKDLDPKAKVKVLSIEAPIDEAIAAAHEFPHAEVRGINDGVLKVRVVVKRAKAADLEEGDEEERTVFGIVLEPETVDSQGDIYDEDTIRETAWKFAERYQHFGLMHRHLVPGIVLLETYLAPVDFEIVDRKGQAQKIKKGTWLLRVRVTDEGIWSAVKDGRLDGFSIGGSAIRQKIRGGKKTAA